MTTGPAPIGERRATCNVFCLSQRNAQVTSDATGQLESRQDICEGAQAIKTCGSMARLYRSVIYIPKYVIGVCMKTKILLFLKVGSYRLGDLA